MIAKRNIVLVGFMGTGKSTVGKILSVRLDMEFVDMDEMIVQRKGKPVPRIFAEDGEAHFRQLERQLAVELSGLSGKIISTGGGIVLNADNIRDYARTGLVVCLKASPESILARVGDDTNRPLLACADKLGKIKELQAKRQPLYEAVPNAIETDGLSAEQVADKILSLYRS